MTTIPTRQQDLLGKLLTMFYVIQLCYCKLIFLVIYMCHMARIYTGVHFRRETNTFRSLNFVNCTLGGQNKLHSRNRDQNSLIRTLAYEQYHQIRSRIVILAIN